MAMYLTSYVNKRDLRARGDTWGEGTRAWVLAIFNHRSGFPVTTTTSNLSHTDERWSMCWFHFTFTSSYFSSFSPSMKLMSRFSFPTSNVLVEVYLKFVLSENWIRRNPSSPDMKSGFRAARMVDITWPRLVASLYQVVFRCGAVSGRVVFTARGRGHIFAAVVMEYFSGWVINKGARRKQNWVRSKNSHPIQLHCKLIWESSGGAVVRALASHQCGPGSIPRLGVICWLSLLVLYSALRGFSPGTPVFPSPQKPTFD